LNICRPAQHLCSSSDVKRVQPLEVASGSILRHRDNVDDSVRTPRAVNHRSCRYAYLRNHLAAITRIARGLIRTQEGDLPEGWSIVGIEGIDAVMFGRYIEDVVCALTRNI